MTDESIIKEKADAYARANKKAIAKQRTSLDEFPQDQFPVSVFMAGSPGAGKTESSRNLIEQLTNSRCVLRIDPDELRIVFEDYSGKNSYLFIGATSIIADKIHDNALDNGQSFVFDGTLSNLNRARENIQRSLDKKRLVQIVYVYQDPKQAWEFVKAREIKEGRKIPRDAFITQYFVARENVNTLKREFGSLLKVDLIVKNIDGTDFSNYQNIDAIDKHILEKYTKGDLERLIV